MALPSTLLRVVGRGLHLAGRALDARPGGPIEADGHRMAPALAAVVRLHRLFPPLAGQAPAVLRRDFRRQVCAFDPPLPEVPWTELRVAGATGLLAARLYRPAGLPTPAPAVLYFHGGGFTLGDVRTAHAGCALLAHHGRCVVINAEYRLAPEHPFPAAPEDAVAVFRDVRARAAALGIDPHRLAVAGDSAGGNLAAVIAQQVRVDGPARQLLVYPGTEMGLTGATHRTLADVPMLLTPDNVAFYLDCYAPDILDPRASPLLGDVAGVAPATVLTCGFDLLRAEGQAYAEKLRAAGVPVEAICHPGLTHGWINILGLLPDARRVWAHVAADFGAALAA